MIMTPCTGRSAFLHRDELNWNTIQEYLLGFIHPERGHLELRCSILQDDGWEKLTQVLVGVEERGEVMARWQWLHLFLLWL